MSAFRIGRVRARLDGLYIVSLSCGEPALHDNPLHAMTWPSEAAARATIDGMWRSPRFTPITFEACNG